jgi:hypothetical protein
MPRLTVTAAGETATVDVEPVGPGLTSVTKLGTGTLNKRMDQLAAGNGITLPPGVISDPDCNYPTNYPVYCYYLAKPTSVTGSSTSASVLEVRAGSLTQTYQKIDSIATPGTNPYRVMRVDKAAVSDLTIRGTNQGTSAKTGKPYSYHGLQFYGTVNPTIRRCRVTDIPGSAGVPPDETFSVEAYRCSGLFTVEDVLVDGPTLEGASAVTVNGTGGPLGVLLRRLTVAGHPNGSAWTTYNTALTSWRAEDVRTDGSMVGFNFEQTVVNGGSKAKDAGIVIVRPDIRNPSNRQYPGAYSHLSIEASSAAASGVSNRVDVYDPVGISTGNPFGVTISAKYGFGAVPSGPQAQRGADIHLWVNGAERPDLILWRRTKGAV